LRLRPIGTPNLVVHLHRKGGDANGKELQDGSSHGSYDEKAGTQDGAGEAASALQAQYGLLILPR